MNIQSIVETAAPIQNSGSVTGDVTDENGAPLPGVEVTVQREALIQTTVTDANGKFRFANLPQGIYTVTAALQGFAVQRVDHVTVGIGSSATINFELKGGPIPIPDSDGGQTSDRFKCEFKKLTSMQALSGWLDGISDARLISIIPVGDEAGIFVFDTTLGPVSHELVEGKKPLNAENVKKEINARSNKKFAGIHRLKGGAYLMVFTDG